MGSMAVMVTLGLLVLGGHGPPGRARCKWFWIHRVHRKYRSNRCPFDGHRPYRRVANRSNRSNRCPFDGHRPYRRVSNRRNRSDRPPFERHRSHRAHWRNRSNRSVANRPYRCRRRAWPKRATRPAYIRASDARQRLGAPWDFADFDEWEHHAAGDRLPERARDH